MGARRSGVGLWGVLCISGAVARKPSRQSLARAASGLASLLVPGTRAIRRVDGWIRLMRAAGVLLAGAAALISAVAASTGTAWSEPGRSPFERRAPVAKPAWETVVSFVRAVAARIETEGAQTRFVMDFQGQPDPAVFVVAGPPRVIVDMPNVQFDLPVPKSTSKGLIKAFRFGLLAPGRSRVVLDVAGPVAIERAELQAGEGGLVRLVVSVVTIDEAQFAAATARGGAMSAAGPSEAGPAPVGRAPNRQRPMIVIDPGHGGLDPGAVGADGILEKDIALAVSRQLEAALKARHRYDVAMSRDGDVFVSLDDRVRFSERAGADLFISIHADSIGSEAAQNIRGATIYTLSGKASDAQARLLADKENAVDLLAGLAITPTDDRDQVRDILIDLLRRETANFSSDFRGLVAKELSKKIAMSRAAERSAAFRVLKQTHSPSVLIELGYMSNPQDQALMRTTAWQKKVATAIANAVEVYFSRRWAGGGG